MVWLLLLIIDAICVGWWIGTLIFDDKKQWPWLIISLIGTVVVFFKCVSADSTKFYARTAVVTGLNTETDIVSVTDGDGVGWGFYGTEGWEIGNVVSMLMDNNGTPENIFDDEIVKATYSGILG